MLAERIRWYSLSVSVSAGATVIEIAGMHAHRVDILDRADDDGIVRAVADHLHLIFLPADQALVDQHFRRRRGLQTRPHDPLIFLAVVSNSAARPAKREARPDHRGQANSFQRSRGFLHRMNDGRARALKADLVHCVAEFLPVLGLLDRLRIGADQLDPEPVESPVLVQRQRRVEPGLPAHRRKDRVGTLLLADLGDDLRRHRFDIGRIRQLRVGHDRRRVRIDHDDPIPFGFQSLDGLTSRIIELRRLADDDRPGADDEDRGNVVALGHSRKLVRWRC